MVHVEDGFWLEEGATYGGRAWATVSFQHQAGSNAFPTQLTNSRSVRLIMRQRSRAGQREDPQMTQRRSPRNLSRLSISLLNAEVFEASDMVSGSSQPYPTGGPFIERGSGKADSGSMQ